MSFLLRTQGSCFLCAIFSLLPFLSSVLFSLLSHPLFLHFLLFIAFFLYSVSLYLMSQTHKQDTVIGKAKEMVRPYYLQKHGKKGESECSALGSLGKCVWLDKS